MATAGAESTGNADVGTATNDGHRDRVVDEKCADDKRDIAEEPQVPAKRGKHFTIFVSGSAGEADLNAVWEDLSCAALPLVEGDAGA